MKKLTIIPLILFSIAVSGCAVTTAGVTKGDERNLARSINDVNAERTVRSRIKRAYDFNLKSVDVDTREGIVVLTGTVPTQKDKIEAERIAWSAPQVDQVGNEIFVKNGLNAGRKIKDSVLETSVKTRLTADKYVKARNINVEIHEGKVYLLGVARNQAELERIAQIASETRGAKEVVSYVTVAGIDSKISEISQSASVQGLSSQIAAPHYSQQTYPQAVPYQQRNLPNFVTQAPQGGGLSAGVSSGTITSAPLSQPIPFKAPLTAQAPTAPTQIQDMGERLNKEFPSDEELGKFRTGAAGEAVSIIESEPYYLDPNTGKEIPVSFIRNFKK